MASIILAGPEENDNETMNGHRLCSTCEKLLIRPQDDWNTDKSTQIGYSRRPYDDIVSSAKISCPICKNLHGSILASPWHQSDLIDRGLSCTLHWNREAGKFDRIGFSTPLVHFKLFSEQDVSFLIRGKGCELASTSSTACVNLVTDWITTCTNHHPQCNREAKEPAWLPTRLVDIGHVEGTCHPRLVNTSEMQKDTEQTKYVALTHRWASQPTVTLSSRNVDHLQRKITLEELPRTFQDAVQFTRSLGMRYLWIDSLCIQQDCQDDWRKESAVMGKVYGQSFCNIAATAAANGEEGLFVDRDIPSHAPFKIDLRWRGHQRTYYCLYSDLWHLGVTSTPLNHRGWVLQERLLSPRTLSFDNTQLFWECRHLQACESFPKGLGPNADFAHEDIDQDSELCSKAWATEVTKPGAQYAPWRKVIEQFMVCSITKATDKLIAVSGIAQEMQSLLGDTYVAGLWERNLTLDLLWYVERWPYSFRGTFYRAPSWSWASVEGRVRFACGHRDYSWGPPLVRIPTVNVESITEDSTGQLKSGYILSSGLLLMLPPMHQVAEHERHLMPGCGTAYCLDDEQDMVLEMVYFFPVRSMESANGVELVGLILTCMFGEFRRVGLISIRRDEIDDFGWNDVFIWSDKHCTGWSSELGCGELVIKIV